MITLTQACDAAPDAVAASRSKMDRDFAPGLFDKALAHHTARQLRADLKKGSTRDVDGFRSQFVGYDWSETYTGRPDWVWFDFFSGTVCYSVSRMHRGLKP